MNQPISAIPRRPAKSGGPVRVFYFTLGSGVTMTSMGDFHRGGTHWVGACVGICFGLSLFIAAIASRPEREPVIRLPGKQIALVLACTLGIPGSLLLPVLGMVPETWRRPVILSFLVVISLGTRVLIQHAERRQKS